MVFDRTRPQGSEKIRNSDDLLRENNQALEDALSEGHEFETGGNQSGKHVSPTFKDVGSKPSQPTKLNELRLYNKSAVLYTLDDAGKSRGVNKNTDIPEGTKMLFKQSSAPSGWTFKSEDNDRVLINTSTEGDGGQTGGDWQLPDTYNHNLSEDELPTMSGEVEFRRIEDDDPGFSTKGDLVTSKEKEGNTLAVLNKTSPSHSADVLEIAFGGDKGHKHGNPSDWRPQYVKTITCSKD